MFADIIAVNVQPAKGLYVGRPRTVLATPTPTPGQAIADTTHNSFRDVYFEILKSNGTPIGSIVATGLSAEPRLQVAFFLAHFPQRWNPALNGGETSVLFCFIFLYLAAAGPGSISLGRLLGAPR